MPPLIVPTFAFVIGLTYNGEKTIGNIITIQRVLLHKSSLFAQTFCNFRFCLWCLSRSSTCLDGVRICSHWMFNSLSHYVHSVRRITKNGATTINNNKKKNNNKQNVAHIHTHRHSERVNQMEDGIHRIHKTIYLSIHLCFYPCICVSIPSVHIVG